MAIRGSMGKFWILKMWMLANKTQLDRYTAEKYPVGEQTSVSSLVTAEVGYSTMNPRDTEGKAA